MTDSAKTLRFALTNFPGALAVIAGLALGASAMAQMQPGSVSPAAAIAADEDGPGRPFYDSRLGANEWPLAHVAAKVAARNAQGAARAAEIAKMRSAMPGLAIDEHPVLGTPVFVRSTSAFLTKATGRGNALDASMDVLRGYLTEHAALFEIDARELDTARVSRNYTTDHNGVRHLTLRQTLGGVDIFDCELRANLMPDGSLINVGSTMLPRPARDFATPARKFDDAGAIVIAAANVGVKIDLSQWPQAASDPQGPTLKRTWQAHPALRSSETITTELVYFPLDRDTLRPAWNVLVPTKGIGHTYEILVDAVDGTILRRHNRLCWDTTQPATFNVFTSDSPAPGSPGPANPINFQPPFVPRTMVTMNPIDWSAWSPNGWINDGNMETVGNNVDAHTDLDDSDTVTGADLPRPNGGASRVFDFPLDPTQDPSTYREASVVQLFYMTNWYHDKLMALGFNEAAGNFQTINFTGQGTGNDAVQADCQDAVSNTATSSNRNNANFGTGGSDGSSARMQMYIFTGSTPDRDGSLDNDIVIHELTHGTSIRLHGGLSGNQPQGMGEGWGDYFGVSLLTESTDDPHGNFATGGYATYQLWGTGYNTNYYFGIRRYPYSTNVSKNPLTYRFMDAAQAAYPSTASVPRNTNITSSLSAVHNVGEIWANVLLEGRAALWAVHGFAGNQRMMQLVIDGMKLSPNNPNFVQARDAILQADVANYGGADLVTLWNAFSKRGLGPGAASPGGTSASGVVESFASIVNATFTYPGGRPSQLAPGLASTFRVDITPSFLTLIPGTANLHVSIGGGAYSAIPLVAVTGGSAGQYNATIPAQLCGASVSYYFSTDTSDGLKADPATAPTAKFAAVVTDGSTPVASDGFETDTGWTVGPNTAGSGVWERATPQGTAAQPGAAFGGSMCFVTDADAGTAVGSFDVDGGYTTLVSPAFDLGAYADATVSYSRWYSNGEGSNAHTNTFRVSVSVDNGSTWTIAETVGPGNSADPNSNPGWNAASWKLSSLGLAPSSAVRVRFVAEDATASVVEAAIDDFAIEGATCTGTPCAVDFDNSGTVTVQDIFQFLNAWFAGAPGSDFNTTGGITVQDIFDFLNAWFVGC